MHQFHTYTFTVFTSELNSMKLHYIRTYPIRYQNTILSEDLTCSTENTLGK